ncbi:MAG: NCS2 family nucleobase:cation symporter [Streptococcaceae bacterium]|jgi:uracil permease|nr:NCS2 family nucleobase:cation symporter [Streptococcaceae bacterium]
MENKPLYDIQDKPKWHLWLGLSFQHLFAMFGATVLVPILVGIDPSVALISSGLGTLAHLTITKFKIPAYMGSSFAYILAMQTLLKHEGYGAVAQGAITSGLVYLIVALIVKKSGTNWIDKILPPIVVGPIVMVIGLSLAGTAVNDAMNIDGAYSLTSVIIALVTVVSIVLFNIYGKGFISLIPILLGIVFGYLFAAVFGALTGTTIVDFAPVLNAQWLSVPKFEIMFAMYGFKFYPSAILTMAPIALVTMTEHFGHLMVLNTLTKRDFFKEPGLDKTLTGDGVAQIIAGFIGGPPVTSYGENIGVMAITKVHSVWVIAGAAGFAIILSFIGKITALIHSIPPAVIGGVSIVLFGVIASSGLKILIENKINFDDKRNLLIASIILVAGIGNLTLRIPGLEVTGVAFSTFLGIILNLVLPKEKGVADV